MLICGTVLQKKCFVMHKLSDVVHVNLYMFGPLPGNWIHGYLNSTLVVTKEKSGQSNTKIKL